MSDLSPEVKAYFKNGRKKILNIKAVEPFSLIIKYDNNETRLYDMSDKMNTPVFSKISDFKKFSKVFLDENGSPAWDIDSKIDSKIHWNNRIDLCPDACYMNSILIE